MGRVLLVSPVSARVFGLVAVCILIGFAALLTFGKFTNKVRVNGWLTPSQGMSRVFSPQVGVITDLRVTEGQKIEKGAPLAVVSTETRTSAVGATQAEVARLLDARRDSLGAEIRQQEALRAQQTEAFARRIAAYRQEIEQLGREADVQASRARLARASAERLGTLRDQGFVSVAQVQQQQELALEQEGRVQTLQRERAERRRELVTLQAELDELPIRSQVAIANLNRAMDEVSQDMALTESRREILLTAPQTGIILSLQAERGSTVTTAIALMSIVPENAVLEAQLFGSSRAVGFVRDGQVVNVRYDAYPYQKFGHHPGKIASVARSGMSPSDLPVELTGLSELFSGTEPIYRITVRLDSQTVTAYGEQYRLHPGMRLDADVLLDTRRLYEWMLEPLYTLTGRL